MKNRFLRTFLILLLIAVLCAGAVYAAARYGSQVSVCPAERFTL